MASRNTRTPGFQLGEFHAPDVPDYVVAELRYDSGLVVTRGGIAAPSAASEARGRGLNETLAAFDLERVGPHFELPQRVLATRSRAVTRSRERVSAGYAQSGFVQVVPKRGKDAKAIASKLARSGAVWSAHVAPRPVPAAAPGGASNLSRNFEPAQGYLHSPPDGIGAMAGWATAGATGKGVTICDIEGNWNLTHEDLPAGIASLGGSVIAGQDWIDHGTAVLGEMVSQRGPIGTVGAARDAGAAVHGCIVAGVFNTAAAITSAAARLKSGDVILIELQATGPNNAYVAMQYWPDVFSAIKAATDQGITVVEAAGNGNQDFDLPVYAGSGLQKASGAIVVGAGIPPTNWYDFHGGGPGTAYSQIGVPRSRIWFSNYGKIVDVQAWGWHVATLGYGDAQGGTTDQNRWYTLRFSGTSSASPIVTAAVACLQGAAKVKTGSALTPAKVRSILMNTGSPQVAGPGVPLSQRIGPQPNLPAALKLI
ncbi:MAG: S8 family serine peptidase [Rubrivivax sp.]|nr:S8 family serine peptidase [Rubrivivax sp.]